MSVVYKGAAPAVLHAVDTPPLTSLYLPDTANSRPFPSVGSSVQCSPEIVVFASPIRPSQRYSDRNPLHISNLPDTHHLVLQFPSKSTVWLVVNIRQSNSQTSDSNREWWCRVRTRSEWKVSTKPFNESSGCLPFVIVPFSPHSSLPGGNPCVRVSVRSRYPSPDLSVPARHHQLPFDCSSTQGSKLHVAVRRDDSRESNLPDTQHFAIHSLTRRPNSLINRNATNFGLETRTWVGGVEFRRDLERNVRAKSFNETFCAHTSFPFHLALTRRFPFHEIPTL